MTGYRVTKYNPKLRDEHGRFLGSEWTSVSEVANTPEARLAYSTVEDAYVKTVCGFYEKADSPRLRVEGLERREDNIQFVLRSLVLDSKERLLRMMSEEVSDTRGLDDIVRLALREVIWCKLELPSVFYVHFGYDFYVYVGGDHVELPDALPGGIYVEAMASPYAEE